MEFIIIAKSVDGWGVVVGEDIVAEFDTAALALSHGGALRTAAMAAGRSAEVVDLSDADTGHPLLRRPDGRA